jgi:hypothetical protein
VLENGTAYRWEEGRGPGEIEPVECPPWLIQVLAGKSRLLASPAQTDGLVESGSILNRARAYLRRCDPAPECG